MTIADLLTQIRFNVWANARIFDAADALTPEQLNHDLRSSFPTIRDTLAHMVAGEWVWLNRWQGHTPSTFPDWQSHSTLEELRAKLSSIEHERAMWVAALTDADVGRVLPYTLFNGTSDRQPIGEMVMHVVNHASYHRGQVTAMMRMVGAKVIGTDRITFTREESAKRA